MREPFDLGGAVNQNNEEQKLSMLIVRHLKANADKKLWERFFTLRDGEKKTPLIAAVLYGMVEAATVIIEQMIEQKSQCRLNDTDQYGATALDYALSLGRTPLVIKLLRSGARFSSLTLVQHYGDSKFTDRMLDRAIICGDRHCDAFCNYFVSSDEYHSPMMLTDDPVYDGKKNKVRWRYIVKHPQNIDALYVMQHAPESVLQGSRDEFARLCKKNSMETYKERLIRQLNETSFLHEFMQILVRSGMHEEVKCLLQRKQNADCDILHPSDTSKLNILHICTNSYNTTSGFCSIDSPEAIDAIVKGRLAIARHIIETYPHLLDDTTKTSEPEEETFTSIVERMQQKCSTLPSSGLANVFNALLYNGLMALCKEKGLKTERDLPVQFDMASFGR